MYQGVIFQFINVEWKKMFYFLEITLFMEVDKLRV